MVTEVRQEPVTAIGANSQGGRSRIWIARLLWWLAPLLGLALVLVSAQSAITERRYSSLNGVSGELLARRSVGQTFVARYPGLSGVGVVVGTYGRGNGPSAASLVLHLRAGQAPGSGPDLATAALPAGAVLGENQWYFFSFAPIADSQNRPFYVEVESPDGAAGKALTLFWWQQPDGAGGDPYPYGTAYLNRKPTRGDLAFGLRYSAGPLQAWAQVMRAASGTFSPVGLLILALAALAGGVWALLRLPVILGDPVRRNRWLARTTLPVALAIALLNGWVYLLVTPPWQGPDEDAHFAYAALLDKYDFDVARVQSLDTGSASGEAELMKAVNASLDRSDFTRRVSWTSFPGAPANAGASLFAEVHQPPAYYLLCAVALRAARMLGLSADPYTNPEAALAVMRWVSLLISLGVVVLAWLAGGGFTRTGKDPWLKLLLPLTVALLPMHAFVASVANNDTLGELAVSALFVTLLALFRWPYGLRGVGLALTAVTLTGLGALTKPSAPAAALPLLGLGLVVWLGMLLTRFLRVRASRIGSRRYNPFLVPVLAFALTLLLLVGGVFLAFEPSDLAAGWHTQYWPVTRAPRTASAAARAGSYVLDVGGPASLEVSQYLVPRVDHPALSVVFSGWARLQGGAGDSKAQVIIAEGDRVAGKSLVALPASGEWTQFTVKGAITEGSDPVAIRLSSVTNGRSLQFDDFSLDVQGPSGPWQDPVFTHQLINPSAETGSVALRPLARFLPTEARQIADALANPQPFSKSELWRSYAAAQYRSFLGNFGWVSLPLPDPASLVASLVGLLSAIGLLWLGISRMGRWTELQWLGFISIVALAVAIIVGFAKQMMLAGVGDNPAYPQGRYLFVLSIPIAWLLITGVGAVWSLLMRGVSGLAVKNAAVSGGIEWGVWLWLNALFIFAAYTILAVIVPYYYA